MPGERANSEGSLKAELQTRFGVQALACSEIVKASLKAELQARLWCKIDSTAVFPLSLGEGNASIASSLLRCVAPVGTEIFLKILGRDTREIRLSGNDFHQSRVPYDMTEDVRKDELHELNNFMPR